MHPVLGRNIFQAVNGLMVGRLNEDGLEVAQVDI